MYGYFGVIVSTKSLTYLILPEQSVVLFAMGFSSHQAVKLMEHIEAESYEISPSLCAFGESLTRLYIQFFLYRSIYGSRHPTVSSPLVQKLRNTGPRAVLPRPCQFPHSVPLRTWSLLAMSPGTLCRPVQNQRESRTFSLPVEWLSKGLSFFMSGISVLTRRFVG